ncbi:hypothetical protein V1L54_11530 [Streptomyces sp. TRM 70361]|uniref:hypothetical protein n=1 Tax=Streptomyces sp. TRM 70361 TaxID=3116553 RepID=UPI002E7C1E2F|nr:hypothetical protein [Streptomyces sp. TRM 70361]MEE1940020.1 hypothetical protein [Streptomyces sp. TRM 70361]
MRVPAPFDGPTRRCSSQATVPVAPAPAGGALFTSLLALAHRVTAPGGGAAGAPADATTPPLFTGPVNGDGVNP